jgi:hypothetical protein
MGALSLITAEQRKFERSRCRVPVTLKTPLVKCRGIVARDISAQGIGVEVGEISPETFIRLTGWCKRFTVKFQLPGGAVRARARLAWKRKVRGPEGTALRAGLEFIKIGRTSRERIRDFLREQSIERMIANYADPHEKDLRKVFIR